ncbi:NAD-dependent epimerase/dehydratase family protein [Streptomyces sp. NPDC005574]|uniref:NAD-dependent epimerase/dehydratase family protein n=1 Tax=Streptomyces sp. NPDC005574 TaxID=3156891 RepID=UPI0033AF848C
MAAHRILITGGISGFVGARVTALLAHQPHPPTLRLLAHRAQPRKPAPAVGNTATRLNDMWTQAEDLRADAAHRPATSMRTRGTNLPTAQGTPPATAGMPGPGDRTRTGPTALHITPAAVPVTPTALHPTPVQAPAPGIEVWNGSLTDPTTLHGLCDGIDTVLHLASHIGTNPELCRAVNDTGTGALLAEAQRSNVKRFIHLSTTAVYRDGRHVGLTEQEAPLGPTSPTSITRLAGEQRVLAAGGIVLRPHLIYGHGDQWLLPALIQFMKTLPHWVNHGQALHSLISAHDLANIITQLALHPTPPPTPILHIARPTPITTRELFTTTAHTHHLPHPTGNITHTQAQTWPGAHTNPAWQRHLSLLTTDHYYDTTPLHTHLNTPAPTPFTDDYTTHTTPHPTYQHHDTHSHDHETDNRRTTTPA